MKFISPKTDFAFKKIFGSIHSQNILISFLNAIVYNNQNIIQSLKIINPYNPGVTNTLKETYLDVKAVLYNGSTVIIEMQILNVEDFEKRVIYNLAKAYGNQLDVGQGYMMLKPFIALTITDFVLFENTDKIITKFRLKEEAENFNYQDEFTLMFLELPKFTKELSGLETLSDKWTYFIKSAPSLEVIPSSLGEVPEIEAALNIANKANLKNEELEALEKQEQLIRDKKGQMSLAKKEGREIGREEGREIGREEGIRIGVVKQVLRQIRRQFGEIAPEVQTQVEQLSLEKLDILGDEIFDLATVVDLENWLANQQLK
ncbi:MAG: Rpn family recombination-promoting nuclease/putative transposase [Okeania sp. SIO3I5]|uniref:Rpn family recombination-promoting nuclease/putative transposase n=1 Tax=Okeania sp. SIO3I5 TaxID=2607805 RepID=UPI0013BCC4D3|nr:Rpn family recombination-promoting nuclease/putative transposase [Okeania sp. SIO3I5]NEQ40755.1 Rpn family recombination-promoting nuclease/putative transposase [Okeania sp. SIO3I5]